MNKKLLIHSVEKFGVQLTEAQLDACDLLVSELKKWNKRINLTAIHGSDDITIKHLVDSLRLVPLLTQGSHLLDIGSGGGFPALPLVIARPDLNVTSIDAIGKKISFQRHIVRQLRLANCETLHGRVEDLTKTRLSEFDFVTSRAFSNFSLFFKLSTPLVKINGKVIAMRGSDSEAELKDNSKIIQSAGFELEEVIKYSLPLDCGERLLIIARKYL